jgi:hypothetical protein
MTTTSNPIMFAHDGTSIFYPCGPGRVYSVRFAGLAEATGSDDVYRTITHRADLHHMVAAGDDLHPLDLGGRKVPATWIAVGGETDDLADAVEMWADYCDRMAAEEDGEAANLRALLVKAEIVAVRRRLVATSQVGHVGSEFAITIDGLHVCRFSGSVPAEEACLSVADIIYQAGYRASMPASEAVRVSARLRGEGNKAA